MSPDLPTSAVAFRARWIARRAICIQSADGEPAEPFSPPMALWMPQVLVEMTSQPTSA